MRSLGSLFWELAHVLEWSLLSRCSDTLRELTLKRHVKQLLVLMVAALSVVIATSCTGTSGMSASASAADDGPEFDDVVEPTVSESVSSEVPDEKALHAILDKVTASLLIERAKSDDDAAWIAAHPDAYAKFGSELQVKLLKLAAEDPLAIPFVRGFPEHAFADGPDYSAPAIDEGVQASSVPKTGIPHLYQWDLRWGYAQFSADGFGLAGCGPTSLAMVYQGLTGKKDITPYDMGRMAEEQGYVMYGEGSTVGLFTEMPWQLGLVCWDVPVDVDAIKQTLDEGHPIIANVGPGYFTQVGHFFVLTGMTEDGKIILNDPFSAERSSKLWDLERIVSESRALFAYAPAEEPAPAQEE